MATFSVDSDAVLSAPSTVAATITRIQGDAASLMAQLTGLQNSWGGSASVAFQGVAAEWGRTQQQVEQSIQAINTALANAANQYLEVEAANARMFSIG